MNVKFLIFLLACVVFVSLLLVSLIPGFDGFKRLVEMEVTGRLNVKGQAPEVISVYLENVYCDFPGGADPVRVSPTQDSSRSIRFNATVYDINGDCNNAATFYICANETAVSPTYCDENYDIISIPATLYAQYGGAKDNLYCNYTATYDLPYFRRCGNWYINVTALDGENKTNSTVRWWHDNTLSAVWYPYINVGEGDVINIGEVSLGQWNNGMGRNWTKNVGNTNITSLLWNATNFTSGSDVIPILPYNGITTFAVDNDTDRLNGAGYINENPTTQISFPSYGMDRCEDATCITTAKARYELYWHVNVSLSISSGVYENKIHLSWTPLSCE
jgi:hypothetical protein